jgi:hypothetical protein
MNRLLFGDNLKWLPKAGHNRLASRDMRRKMLIERIRREMQ